MSFSINTNITSLQAQNYLRINQNFQAGTINQVTSGLRIVNSGDDAAGLAIANGDRSNEAVLTQGIQNANSGLASLQIADGGMSNISQLLDRARTLATQSASGAFTGDRGVLNSEFQSVIQEVNRQAQSIGLNQGGQFATNLGVFVGGGQASNGITATDNGTVSINLSQSTVDANSLGLSGVQASGKTGTDIGAGAGATSLSSILANTTNSSSTATTGYTNFILKGPGFDGNGVTVSVNTANLGGTSDLVAAVNSAITAAAGGGTQQATALKNANIVASVTTDSTNKQQLTFQSATTAFQVQAGDRLSNALMGNFGTNASATSTDNNAFISTATNHTLTFSTAADGSGATTLNLTTQAAGTSKGEIVKELNASTLNTVGVASLSGNQIVITANDPAKSLTLGGNLATALGFSTATAAYAPSAASTGAALNTQVQGATALAANANIYGTDSGATSTVTTGTNDKLSISVNGTATVLTLTGATTETKAQLATDINAQITADAGNLAGKVAASVLNNHIVLSATHAGDSVAVTVGGGQDASALLGVASTTTSTTNTATSSDTIKLQFQGSGLTSPVTITLAATTAGTTTSAQVLADLQSKINANSALSGAGISLTSDALGNSLAFTSAKGEQFQVVASGDSTNMLGLGSFQAGAGSTTPVDYTTATGTVYSSTVQGSGAATFEVSLNGQASNVTTAGAATQFSVNLNGAGTDATAGSQAGTVVLTSGTNSFAGSAGVGAAIDVRVDGGATQSIVLGNSAAETATQILAAFNTGGGALVGATASYTAAGKLQITSNSTGTNSSVEIVNAAQGTDAALLTAVGLTGGSVQRGANATEGNVIAQINSAIAGSSTLTNAGLQATDLASSGAITLQSNNGTAFRLNTYGTGNAGFGNTGTSFAGNAQSAPPAVSQYFDAQGADASATLAFKDTLYGSDVQNVTLTAVDASGGKHSLSVPVQNDPAARSQSIDQALSTINTALQQSNDNTLNQIVAVKEDTSGGQSIRFLSTVKGFQVAVSSDSGGTGITPPTGNVSTATTIGAGSNADISNVSTATAAVNQLAKSVATLGNAQAAVGRGENKFNYAINLANSQLTNLAAAESSIRDANMAAESANLTKAQIQMQAGVAALAQANSAPQQILSLLQGH